jgi:hypothetical protein
MKGGDVSVIIDGETVIKTTESHDEDIRYSIAETFGGKACHYVHEKDWRRLKTTKEIIAYMEANALSAPVYGSLMFLDDRELASELVDHAESQKLGVKSVWCTTRGGPIDGFGLILQEFGEVKGEGLASRLMKVCVTRGYALHVEMPSSVRVCERSHPDEACYEIRDMLSLVEDSTLKRGGHVYKLVDGRVQLEDGTPVTSLVNRTEWVRTPKGIIPKV